MSLNRVNQKDEGSKNSFVNEQGEPSQWNVEVLVRFKCNLEEVFAEEILEVSDVLSASEFAGKVAQVFAAQIKQSGVKFLLIKKRDRSSAYVALKMSDIGFLRDGDVFEVQAIVSPDGQDGSTLYALVPEMLPNVTPSNAHTISTNASSHSIDVVINSQRLQSKHCQSQFYPSGPSFYGSVCGAQPSPMYFPMPRNPTFNSLPPPMHPAVSQFFGAYNIPKPPAQQKVVPGHQNSPSSLSHSWNNSWPGQSSQHQQNISRNQLKQEVERQRQQQTSSQTTVVPTLVQPESTFSPPTNLVHLFIPAHWKNYPRILHGAIEEAMENSVLQNSQKIEMRRVLIETIVNGRVPSESIQNSAVQLPEDAIFSYLDKVKANMISVLGETQSAVQSDVSSKSYMELKKKKKRTADLEAQPQSLFCDNDSLLLKKVKLEPGISDGESASLNAVNEKPEIRPELITSVSATERFLSPDATSDCVLIVQGCGLHLNKGFLAVNSVVFRELLQKQAKLEVSDVDVNDFLQLLEFIYPSEKQCVVTKHNIEILLNLASRFRMAEVLKRCEEHLMNSASGVDCTLAKRLYLAQEFGLIKLKDECIKQCVSMNDLRAIQAEKEYKMLKDKTIVELVENITQSSC